MAYHHSKKLSLSALEKVAALSLLDRQMAAMLHAHYAADKPDYQSLHAVLILILEKNPFNAAARITAERGRISLETAMGILSTAVRSGPEQWLSDKAYIYSLGMLYAKGRFFPVKDEFSSRSSFDLNCRKVRPVFQSIIEEAIFLAFAGSRKEDIQIDRKILAYIPVQLMEPSPERNFKMTALSLRYPGIESGGAKFTSRHHAGNIEKSARVILQLAELLRIILPSDHLERAGPSRKSKSRHGEKDVTGPKNIKNKKPANDKAPTALTHLRKKLVLLIKKKQISREEAQIYFWLKTGPGLRLPAEAAAHFKKPQKMIETVTVKIARLTGAASNGNLHKPRAVRPK